MNKNNFFVYAAYILINAGFAVFIYACKINNLPFSLLNLISFFAALNILFSFLFLALKQLKNINTSKIFFFCVTPFIFFFSSPFLSIFHFNLRHLTSPLKYLFFISIFISLCFFIIIILTYIIFQRNNKFTDKNGLAALLLLFFVFGFFILITSYIHGIHGDEINHIWLSKSLSSDFDLNLINNVPKESLYLITHYYFKNNGEKVYSSNLPGVSILCLPGYYFFGTFGIRLTILLLSIFLYYLIWKLTLKNNIDYRAVFTACVFLGFSHPLIFYTSQIYPEIFAAVFLLLFFILLENKKYILTGLITGCIFWLHSKYIFLAFLMALSAVYWILKEKNKIRNILIFIITPVFLFFLICYYNYTIYGIWNPFGAYIKGSDNHFLGFTELLNNRLNISIFKRLYFEMLNPQFGLFINNPFYILVFAVLLIQIIKNFKTCGHYAFIIIAYIIYICANDEGYNGFAPLNRLLIPVLPLLIIPFSKFLSDLFQNTNIKKIKLIYIFFWISFIITIFFILIPVMRYPNFYQKNNLLYYLIKQ